MDDYYALLEIGSEATLDEIKAAYRKMALKYHPDINKDPEANSIFKRMNEAFYTLNSVERRAIYDLKRPKHYPGSSSPSKGSVPKEKRNKKEPRRPIYSPFNFTIDVDVGDVDLWNQTFTRLKEEEAVMENEKRVREEREKIRQKKAEELRRQEEQRRRNYRPPPPPVRRDRRKDSGWFDLYANEYLD